MAQVKPKDAIEADAGAEAYERFLRIREEFAEATKHLTEEEQVELGERWAAEVRARLAARVRRMRQEREG